MYEEGLGLSVVSRFHNHDGFDGVIFGEEGGEYRIEFTHCRGEEVGRAPSEDHLLVFGLRMRTSSQDCARGCSVLDLWNGNPSIPSGTRKGGPSRMWMDTGSFCRKGIASKWVWFKDGLANVGVECWRNGSPSFQPVS